MEFEADDDVDPGYLPAQGTFLAQAGAETCSELRALGSRATFDRNDFLLLADQPSDHVLLIERGLVKVLLPGDGRDLIAGIYGEGELLGEQGVLFAKPRSANVLAHTKSEATRVPRPDFQRFLDRRPELLLILSRILHDRLSKADRRQVNLASQDVPTRVARQLLAWAESLGTSTADGVSIRSLSRKDLAQCIGAAEATVDAALKQLSEIGLVRTRWRTFVLPSPHRLRCHLRSRGSVT